MQGSVQSKHGALGKRISLTVQKVSSLFAGFLGYAAHLRWDHFNKETIDSLMVIAIEKLSGYKVTA
jgi:hypothetical protein